MLDPATEVIAEAMHSYALTLEYDGSRFSGWQRQPDRRTVEGVLRDALLAVTGEEVRLTAAGRTDAGAHAHGQVVGCTLRRPWEPRRLRAALNARLPEDAVVLEVRSAPDGFHARYDARTRTYRYVVAPRAERGAVARDHVWRVPRSLDLEAMRGAAAHLVGTHDFAAFGRSPRAGGATVRTIHSLTVRAHAVPDAHGGSETPIPIPGGSAGEPPRMIVTIDVTADAFLYGMMRAIAATLVAVGDGRLDAPSVASLLDAPGRARRQPPAPAHGLHQWAVTYDLPQGDGDEDR
ncbi:MAG: tRNA pseudouridine38-40 synthase [Chloroflexota bacterium]|nr:tRNA pseudouridine38-40 synthase [Chloroflexota bacterium]